MQVFFVISLATRDWMVDPRGSICLSKSRRDSITSSPRTQGVILERSDRISWRLVPEWQRRNPSVTVQKQRTVLFFHCVRFPSYNLSQKQKRHTWRVPLLFLVDPRGIEPLSENLLIWPSPSAVYYLEFPAGDVNRQTSPLGSHFLRDRFNGETPMHVHR